MSIYADGKRVFPVWPEIILVPLECLLIVPYLLILAFSIYCNGDLP